MKDFRGTTVTVLETTSHHLGDIVELAVIEGAGQVEQAQLVVVTVGHQARTVRGPGIIQGAGKSRVSLGLIEQPSNISAKFHRT